jgi:hypothetical protein
MLLQQGSELIVVLNAKRSNENDGLEQRVTHVTLKSFENLPAAIF